MEIKTWRDFSYEYFFQVSVVFEISDTLMWDIQKWMGKYKSQLT